MNEGPAGPEEREFAETEEATVTVTDQGAKKNKEGKEGNRKDKAGAEPRRSRNTATATKPKF